MTRYVLVPGAGGAAWYWDRVAALLAEAGHHPIPVDLPGADEHAGLPEYTDITCAAAGNEPDTVLVAQSLGGFTAAEAAEQISPRAIILVNAMIPEPGELVGDWWEATDAADARIAAAKRHGYSTDFDLQTYFLHDVMPDIAQEAAQHQQDESDTVFGSICTFTSWPSVPIHVVAGADDRFFPLEFQRRVARERLGAEPDVLPGGHLIALSQPHILADYLGGI